MKVGVIGTGHVGLITCVTLAKVGHIVSGSDTDGEKLAGLLQAKLPFFEPGLGVMLKEQLASGRLSFTQSTEEAVSDAEVVFISVGTPPRASGEANLIAVEKSAAEVARHAKEKTLVVEKSTVPTGTAAKLQKAFHRLRGPDREELEVASNPEFLREGRAIQDAMNPERILVGAESEWSFDVMRRVYQRWIDQEIPYIETDVATAELAKHASNAFLALKISFVNALARICEKAGADVEAVAATMGSDPRIGRAFLNAGLGYGGSCFPKDLRAFEHLVGQLGYDFPLLREISRINDEAVDSVLDKIMDALWNLDDKRIALLGLSFKPDTDDVRFSPALALAKKLAEKGARVVGCDPVASMSVKAEMPEMEIGSDPYESVDGAHCVVFCTEWPVFLDLDLERVKNSMVHPVMIDARNLFDSSQMETLGFTYYSMGRPAVGLQ